MSSFPAISTRADHKRVTRALRAMRRAARLFRANGDRAHLSFAVAMRDIASAYRTV